MYLSLFHSYCWTVTVRFRVGCFVCHARAHDKSLKPIFVYLRNYVANDSALNYKVLLTLPALHPNGTVGFRRVHLASNETGTRNASNRAGLGKTYCLVQSL